ncbi:MAG: hypothetical protein ACFCU7_05000 [Pleurocapsa sp.]
MAQFSNGAIALGMTVRANGRSPLHIQSDNVWWCNVVYISRISAVRSHLSVENFGSAIAILLFFELFAV